MNGQFTKYIKKLRLFSIVKSLIVAISSALVTLSAFLLVNKFADSKIKTPIVVLIPILVALIAFGISYLLHRKSEKRVAKELDKSEGLSEKVQTMLAYKDQSGEMIELQREDAQRTLSSLPEKTFRVKFLWIYLAVLCVAIAFFVVALVLKPAEVTPPEEEEIPFDVTDEQLVRLRLLIEYVQESYMQEGAKVLVVARLEQLLAEIQEIELESQMQESVVSAILEIRRVVDAQATYDELAYALSNTGSLQCLKLASVLRTLGSDRFETVYANLQASFTAEPTEEQTDVLAMKALLLDFALKTNEALTASGVSEQDSLYQIIYSLVNGTDEDEIRTFDEIAELIESYTYNWSQSQLEVLFYISSEPFMNELTAQFETVEVGEYVENELKSIFGITDDLIPDDGEGGTQGGSSTRPPEADDGDDDDEEDIITDGGYGDGNEIFGGEEYIYDPEKDEYVPYYEVLDEYNSTAWELILDEDTPEDVKNFLKYYFDMLYSGIN